VTRRNAPPGKGEVWNARVLLREIRNIQLLHLPVDNKQFRRPGVERDQLTHGIKAALRNIFARIFPPARSDTASQPTNVRRRVNEDCPLPGAQSPRTRKQFPFALAAKWGYFLRPAFSSRTAELFGSKDSPKGPTLYKARLYTYRPYCYRYAPAEPAG
jgi:hypothetical protein